MQLRTVLLAGLSVVVASSTMLAGSTAVSSVEVLHHRHLFVHRDPVGDVERMNISTTEEHLVPHRREGDITRVRARYGQHNLYLSMYFAKLRPPKHGEAYSLLNITTSTGDFDVTQVVITRAHPHGVLWFLGDHSTLNFRPACPASHSVNYARKRERIVLSAYCLNRPRWVRVTFAQAEDRGVEHVYDDGLARGFGPRRDGINRSPRVYR